ncbi:MAG: ATP-binding protein [Firmicutes bacterium]|nr:ATP-binding protein [Bacillota bacterium]MBQ3111930.1 ATP-binding protein [Bacillota bacterium]MBQ6842701.1 ATP-binding protein [Bacillota bacterium]MBR6824751.1 ATP-binding protein [Bacillota bacterium]MBR7114156.1 ATP-binding protein [Bacillota bacterium]
MENELSKVTVERFWQMPENALPDSKVYDCTLCRDSGWLLDGADARPCICRSEATLRRRRKQAGLSPALAEKSFAGFDLAFYPLKGRDGAKAPRQQAKEALKQAMDFAEAVCSGAPTSGLLLVGECGSGKTHLAAAIVNRIVEQGKEALFLVVPDFLDLLKASYEDDDLHEHQLMQQAKDAPVLILDDLGAHSFSNWTKSKLFSLINYRLNHQLPCVITTNLSNEQLIDELDMRIVSRLHEMCRVCTLPGGCDNRLRRKEVRG